MQSIKDALFKPKKNDTSLLARFYYADEELCRVIRELDSFDGRKNPQRCTRLVMKLRSKQDKVLNILSNIMEWTIPIQRACRDYRLKFPDDVIAEGFYGQLWFSAEYLAAGQCILGRYLESCELRPIAKDFCQQLENVRHLLKKQSLSNLYTFHDQIKEALIVFDSKFASYEMSYVSIISRVKSPKQYELFQEVIILFSETLSRALKMGLITQSQIEDIEPSLVFAIPRLAVVAGLIHFEGGPIDYRRGQPNMPEMFQPFRSILKKIRQLLAKLDGQLTALELALCNLRDAPDGSEEETFQDESASKSTQDEVFVEASTDADEPEHHRSRSARSSAIASATSSELSQSQQPSQENISFSRQFRRIAIVDRNRQEDEDGRRQEYLQYVRNSVDSRLNGLIQSLNLEVSANRPPYAEGPSEISHEDRTRLEYRSRRRSRRSRQHGGSYQSSREGDLELACAISSAEETMKMVWSRECDIIHGLFVCISGVADQLQTSSASDMRMVFKSLFELYSNPAVSCESADKSCSPCFKVESGNDMLAVTNPAVWIPDECALSCMRCSKAFTTFRRRHHCRKCGLIFCNSCSNHFLPLKEFLQLGRVRICNLCYTKSTKEEL